LFTYILKGKSGTVVFPDKVTFKEAHRRLVVKFGDDVKLQGYDK